MAVERRVLRVTGTVQGVGFRPFVYRLAVELGLAGSVANDSRGVTIDVEGPADDLDELQRRLLAEAPPLARIATLAVATAAPLLRSGTQPALRSGTQPALRSGTQPALRSGTQPAGERGGFSIVDSRAEGAPAVAVSVDVATCADCRAELVDPTDRRFGYPFVNCTNCGPRYTIILSIPYDRAATTMAVFPMCDDCRKEYEDPANRRFHAEPTACPVCGPHVRLVGPG
ncbi:MAG TPA: acylphosphatase, partial [Acidimicrobiales bacterium]|nr:acylphosphatase [Acidimicrobiales bacterium]